MKKTVNISGKSILMEANGGTLREYRKIFQRDFLSDLFKLEKQVKEKNIESIEVFENIAWILAYKANPNIPPIDEWLEQFDGMFDIAVAMKDISSLINVSSKTIVKPKKKKSYHQKQQHMKNY